MDFLIVITSSLISGLLGVVISTLYHKKAERRREKVELVKQLFGNKYDLNGEKFSEALNSIVIVFYDSSTVIKKLKTFHDLVSDNTSNENTRKVDDALIDLFKALVKDVKLGTEELNDNFMLRAFSTKQQIKVK
jgi:hypothetical protein